MKHTFLLSILIFSLSFKVFPCSIDPSKIPYCRAANFGKQLLASGTIFKKIDRGYIIRLHEVYKGEEERCEIKVFERKDEDCNGLLFDYKLNLLGKVGDVILFRARLITSADTDWAEEGEYYSPYVKIGSYSPLERPLKRSGNKYKGFFKEGQNSVSVDKVWQELSDCGVENLLPEARPICGSFSINIYPNPANEVVFLDQIVESFTSIELFDLNGNLVHKQNSYDPSLGISTAQLASGLYIIVAKLGNATFKQKLLVSR
ncbi:MAG: T9SS type A sorting domain-containing protein [Bacteroidota bacterium]